MKYNPHHKEKNESGYSVELAAIAICFMALAFCFGLIIQTIIGIGDPAEPFGKEQLIKRNIIEYNEKTGELQYIE